MKRTLLAIPFAWLAATWLTTGCTSAKKVDPQPLSRFDRFVGHYPELKDGRFLILADFENAQQLQVVKLKNASGTAEARIENGPGNEATGSGGLVFRSGHRDDELVFTNRGAQDWHLKRDWRSYDLLLIHLKPALGLGSPPTSARLSIASGQGDRRESIETVIPIKEGGHTTTLDLAEVGEHIALDDIRELRLALDHKENGAVVVDDLILTHHQEDIFVSPEESEGDLYVLRKGKRHRIGARGRFELAFSNGQIAEWYNLKADPSRFRNLVRATQLGPTPVPMGTPQIRQDGFTRLGKTVRVKETVREANPVRVVLDVSMWYSNAGAFSPDGEPTLRFAYSIYATGQIYVEVRHVASAGNWVPAQFALCLSAFNDGFGKPEIFQPRFSDSKRGPLSHPGFATYVNERLENYLLFCAGGSNADARISLLNSDSTTSSWMGVVAEPLGAKALSWACHLYLGEFGRIGPDESSQRVLDYWRGPPIWIQLGSRVEEDAIAPGGSTARPRHATGSVTIKPEGGRVRFRVGSDAQPTFSPAFEIMATGFERAWIYVDHVLVEDTAMNAAGHVLFQLPGAIKKEVEVEVHLQ